MSCMDLLKTGCTPEPETNVGSNSEGVAIGREHEVSGRQAGGEMRHFLRRRQIDPLDSAFAQSHRQAPSTRMELEAVSALAPGLHRGHFSKIGRSPDPDPMIPTRGSKQASVGRKPELKNAPEIGGEDALGAVGEVDDPQLQVGATERDSSSLG